MLQPIGATGRGTALVLQEDPVEWDDTVQLLAAKGFEARYQDKTFDSQDAPLQDISRPLHMFGLFYQGGSLAPVRAVGRSLASSKGGNRLAVLVA